MTQENGPYAGESLDEVARELDREVAAREASAQRRNSRAVEELRQLREYARLRFRMDMMARVTEVSRTPFLLCRYNGFTHHIIYMTKANNFQVYRWKEGARQSSREGITARKRSQVVAFIRNLPPAPGEDR